MLRFISFKFLLIVGNLFLIYSLLNAQLVEDWRIKQSGSADRILQLGDTLLITGSIIDGIGFKWLDTEGNLFGEDSIKLQDTLDFSFGYHLATLPNKSTLFVTPCSGVPPCKFIFIRFDEEGNREWVKFNDEIPVYSAIRDYEMGASGTSYIQGDFDNGLFISSFNSEGEMNWANPFLGERDEMSVRGPIILDSEEAVFMGLRQYYFPSFEEELGVIKYSSEGDSLWIHKWDYIQSEVEFSSESITNLKVNGNDDLFITGTAYQINYMDSVVEDDNIYVKKLNGETGEEEWLYWYNSLGNFEDIAIDAKSMSDDGLLVVGLIKTDSLDLLKLLRLDAQGGLKWELDYNWTFFEKNHITGSSLCELEGICPDKFLTVDSQNNVYLNGIKGEKHFIQKLNSEGVLEWEYLIDKPDSVTFITRSFYISDTDEKLFFLAGEENVFKSQIIQFSLPPDTTTNQDTIDSVLVPSIAKSFVQLSPNPAVNQILVENNHSGTWQIEIFHYSGKKVWEQKEIHTSQLQIPISSWNSALYHYKVQTQNGQIQTGKFVKK